MAKILKTLGKFFRKITPEEREVKERWEAEKAIRAQQVSAGRIEVMGTKERVLRKKIAAIEAEKRVKALEAKHRYLKAERIRTIGKTFFNLGTKPFKPSKTSRPLKPLLRPKPSQKLKPLEPSPNEWYERSFLTGKLIKRKRL